MESIIKTTKYLVLGEFLNAFHGVTLPSYLFLIILIFCAGCSCFEDNRAVVKPKINTTSRKFREILSIFIKQRYKTEMTLKEIQAELAYQEYLMENKNKNDPI